MIDKNNFGGTTSSGSVYLDGTCIGDDVEFTINFYNPDSPIYKIKRFFNLDHYTRRRLGDILLGAALSLVGVLSLVVLL